MSVHNLKFALSKWRNNNTVLDEFYQAGTPEWSRDYRKQSMLALDLELTGLDPKHDAILSMATVPIENDKIILEQAWHQFVRFEGGVGQSAAIHGIHDNQLAQGIELKQAVAALLPQLEGRVLVCHHAGLDLSFLQQGFKRHFGQALPLNAIDTLKIEQGRLARQGQQITRESLRLATCRRRYGLPDYPGHNALVDAIACAELLLAQGKAIAGKGNLSLQELLRLSRA